MLDSIKNIFYRPEFYRKQEFTTSQALGFYSLSVLFLVIGFSLIVIPALWGVNRYFGTDAWKYQQGIVENLYPEGLVLTLGNGKLLTNQTDPVVIPFPDQWKNSSRCTKPYQDCTTRNDTYNWPTNLLVIDRGAEVSRTAIEAHDTIILASETEIGFSNTHRGETRIFGLSQANFGKTISITRDQFVNWISRGTSIVQTATLFLMAVLPLFMFIGLWIGHLFYSLIGALVVLLAAHFRHHHLSYGRAYLSTLHLLPASFVLAVILSALSYRIPLLFTIVLFVMALINLEKRSPAETVPLPTPVEPPVTPARPA